MIVDEPDDAPASATPGSFPGVVRSLSDRVKAAASDPIERERLTYRAQDLQEKLSDAKAVLASAVDSIRAKSAQAFDQADMSVKLLVGRYRGHAARVSQEAVDGLAKFANKCRDSLQRRLAEARDALWKTVGRPSASRSETAALSALSPLDAAAYVVQSKMEAAELTGLGGVPVTTIPPASGGGLAGPFGTTTGGGGTGSSSPPAGRSVFCYYDDLGNYVCPPDDGGGGGGGGSPPPGGGGGSPPPGGGGPGDEPPDDGDGDEPGGIDYCSLASLIDPLAGLLAALAQGGVIQPPIVVTGGEGDGPVTITVTILMPDGTIITITYSGVVDRFGTGEDRGQGFIEGWPEGIVPIEQTGCETDDDDDESGEEPEPPPPPPEPACCPPDPLELNDGTANELLPAWRDNSLPGATWCERMEQTLDMIASTGAPPPGDPVPGQPPADPPPRSVWAWTFDTTPSGFAYNLAKEFAFAKTPVKGSEAEALNHTQVFNNKVIQKYVGSLETDIPEYAPKIPGLLGALSLFSWAEKFTGAPIQWMAKPYVQALNYLLPRDLPGQADVDGLYLTGKATESDWTCMTRSLGNLPGIAARVRDMKFTVPNVSEQIDLWMRKKIDYPDLAQRLKYQGVQDDNTINEWLALREQIPQFADIIRFMVRDTENEIVVQEGNLDAEFENNFKGQLASWAEQQGVPIELAIRFWRAHWELPSPTMAYEMLRRLRPGRVAPHLEVDKEAVKRLLGTADYAPGWRDKMIAVSYLTPTRTDIKQGYSRGVYNREKIIEMLQDTGLDDKGAEEIAKLYDWEKQQFARVRTEKASAISVKGILSYYADAVINLKEATELLQRFGFDQEQIDSLLQSADLRATAETRKACILAVRRRYFVGAIDELTAGKLLMARDIDQGQAEDLVERWNCQVSASVQEVPAKKNLEWAVRGVISIAELETRLYRLRYQDQDVTRFVAEATQRISEAIARAADKALREEIARRRANLAELRRQIADLEKKKKELEKGQGGKK